MRLVHTVTETREVIAAARSRGWKIGLVPTMGALHDGHMSLVSRARSECGFVAVSIFVNPTQFGPGEDLDRYPRALVEDTEKCRMTDVDLVFAPSKSEMYPEGFDSWVEVHGPVAETLEGEHRPDHFRGVATVCAKLFNITQPACAYFGMKDYQQLQVIRKMVRDLNLPLGIVQCETVREPDGLAMSSRNAYLNPEERQTALVLSRSLRESRVAFDAGERDALVIQGLCESLIKAEPLARIDYVAVRDAVTLAPVADMSRPCVVMLAVRVGATRLIDNTVLE